MKKIVFIGDTETLPAIEHIILHREADNEVYLAECGEQLVRRIIDADEVHLFRVTPYDSFELGMVYFFAIHARHYKLHWKIKIFGYTSDGGMLRMFVEDGGPEATSGLKLMDVEFVPVPVLTKAKSVIEIGSKEHDDMVEPGNDKV